MLTILESILLQNDKVNLSIEELQTSLNTVNDIISLGHSLKNSILDIIAERYRQELLENEIYYNDIYMPKLIDNSSNVFKPSNKKSIQIPPLIEKIGGVPTLKRGEKWPILNGEYLTFVAQFKYPNEQNNILYRIFANLDDKMANYYISMPLVIKETNNYLKNIKLSFPEGKLIKEYIIQEWHTCKELKPFSHIYKEHICEKSTIEEIYDSILNTKQEIPSEQEITLGFKFGGNSLIDEKKLMFQISADLIEKDSHDDGIYYFYEDGYKQYLCA